MKPNYDVRFMICSSIDLIMPIGFNQSSSTVQLQGKCSSQDPCTVFINICFIELINNVSRESIGQCLQKEKNSKDVFGQSKQKNLDSKRIIVIKSTVLI